MSDDALDREGPRTESKRRRASTGFPVVSLPEAAQILKEAGKYGFEYTVAEFASHMGHTTTNSGAFRQRLAAFRDWRLVTGRGERLALTEAGRVIARPPGPNEEHAALYSTFTSCAVFFRLYEGTPKDTPLDRGRLGNRAVHQLHISPTSVDKFVSSFVDSASAVGLARESDDGQVTLVDPISTPSDEPAPPNSEPMHAPTSDAPPAQLSAHTPFTHRSAWPIDGGTIVFEIRSDRSLPAGTYATVGEVVASLERLARELAPSSGHAAPDLEPE